MTRAADCQTARSFQRIRSRLFSLRARRNHTGPRPLRTMQATEASRGTGTPSRIRCTPTPTPTAGSPPAGALRNTP
eukprot:1178872-Prorocentrum_minimum.AAC.2